MAGCCPPGSSSRATRPRSRRAFAELCALQPVRLATDGLVCAPRSAPELAGPALATCPLPWRALAMVPGWPDPPAQMVAGWYRRSPAHAPAPDGVRELVQAPGEGFGPAGHATTAMCLEMLDACRLPTPSMSAAARDCSPRPGSPSAAGPSLACDLDPRALDQAAPQPRRRRPRGAGHAAPRPDRRRSTPASSPGGWCSPTSLRRAPSLLERTAAAAACARAVGTPPAEAAAWSTPAARAGSTCAAATSAAGFTAVCMAPREPRLADLVGAGPVRARDESDHAPHPDLPGRARVQRHRRDPLPRLLRRGPRALDADPRPGLGPDRAQAGAPRGARDPRASPRRS